MKIRCVVTGQTESGKSVFVNDSVLEPITVELLPGFEFHRVWGSDSSPMLPSDGTKPTYHTYFPPNGGYRFAFFALPPNTQRMTENIDMGAAMAEFREKLPGVAEVLELDHPGMHTTDTVDFDVILSGEVYLQLDDGAEVLLKPGDCVVQNGTRHAWHNRSAESCVIAVALVGANRVR